MRLPLSEGQPPCGNPMISEFAPALPQETSAILIHRSFQEFSISQDLTGITDCLDAIERKVGFTGDAAILMLSWAIAAHKSEIELIATEKGIRW